MVGCKAELPVVLKHHGGWGRCPCGPPGHQQLSGGTTLWVTVAWGGYFTYRRFSFPLSLEYSINLCLAGRKIALLLEMSPQVTAR